MLNYTHDIPTKHTQIQYMSIKRHHSNYSVVSFPHYSSSTVVLTVFVYLSIEHHSSETVITILY